MVKVHCGRIKTLKSQSKQCVGFMSFFNMMMCLCLVIECYCMSSCQSMSQSRGISFCHVTSLISLSVTSLSCHCHVSVTSISVSVMSLSCHCQVDIPAIFLQNSICVSRHVTCYLCRSCQCRRISLSYSTTWSYCLTYQTIQITAHMSTGDHFTTINRSCRKLVFKQIMLLK